MGVYCPVRLAWHYVYVRLSSYRSTQAFCRNCLTGYHLHLRSAFLRTTADGIVHEYEPQVPNSYIALEIVKGLLANGTDCILLFVVYSTITNRFCYIKKDKRAHMLTQQIHVGIAVLVFLVGLADSIVFVYAQIYISTHAADDAGAINIFNVYSKIHLCFTGVYCAASLEMFACAVWIFSQSQSCVSRAQKEKEHSCRPRHHISDFLILHLQVSKYLIVMVTPFLVIRSGYNLASAVIYVYLGYDQPDSSGVTSAVLLGIAAVVLYAGLVFMGFCKDWDWQDDSARTGIGRMHAFRTPT